MKRFKLTESDLYSHSIIRDGHRLSIIQDDTSDSPRDWDNIGTMVLFHNRYNLANETSIVQGYFRDWLDLQKVLKNQYKSKVIIPVYMLDHSGVCLKTTPFNNRWDSGQVGFIFADPQQLEKMGSTHLSPVRLEEILIAEVETYSKYLSGEVYGYRLEKIEKCKCCNHISYTEIDSCWGFYDMESMLDYIN